MGLFGMPSKKEREELEEANKYCETISVDRRSKLDIEIANRIKSGRKIKDIQIKAFTGESFVATFIYDYNPFEEKLAKQKESNYEIGEEKLKESHNYCEILTFKNNEEIEIAISERIKAGKKIKDIKLTEGNSNKTIAILYDYED